MIHWKIILVACLILLGLFVLGLTLVGRHLAQKKPKAISARVEWPFDQPKNCASVTTRQILSGEAPILLVSHDADDHGWQFIGVDFTGVADGRIVCLSTIVAMDSSVLDVADLPPGWHATRSAPDEPWVRKIAPIQPNE